MLRWLTPKNLGWVALLMSTAALIISIMAGLAVGYAVAEFEEFAEKARLVLDRHDKAFYRVFEDPWTDLAEAARTKPYRTEPSRPPEPAFQLPGPPTTLPPGVPPAPAN